MTRNFVAIDLGAESGRAIVGSFDGARLTLREAHRFPNRSVRVAGHLHWDVLRLNDEIQNGLARAAQQFGDIASVGVDTWGVDFALLDKTGALIGNPYHYRDQRTDGMMARAFERVPRDEIFSTTGIQFMQINTLYQLYAMRGSPALNIADTLLMIPDLINYWLTGEKVGEYTIATTTQCFDARQRAWARALLERLSLPTQIFPRVIPPATIIGRLGAPHQAGLNHTQVIAPACHDTGSAVAAIPAQDANFAYISSGTWSLMGAVVPEPLINDATRDGNFTNEGGVAGTIRLLKNIAGMWLVQECRRAWARNGEELSYDALVALAKQAQPFQAFVDADHHAFMNPDDMPRALQNFCIEAGQSAPRDQGSLVRVILESLALKYRLTLARLEKIIGHRLDVIHIVGGGSQNELLCQFTADACARPVFAGPVEATALGNLAAQLIASGDCTSWDDARAIIRATFPLKTYTPGDPAHWDEAYERFTRIADSK
ncbi:MAG: rhamnulokinase [Chloroflexi bacterium]|nr:rhamnulokinase [Chloroflexota bacterium]